MFFFSERGSILRTKKSTECFVKRGPEKKRFENIISGPRNTKHSVDFLVLYLKWTLSHSKKPTTRKDLPVGLALGY